MFNSKKFNEGLFNGGRKISVVVESVTRSSSTVSAEVYEATSIHSVTISKTNIGVTIERHVLVDSVTHSSTAVIADKFIHANIDRSVTQTKTTVIGDILIHGIAKSVTRSRTLVNATIRSYKTDPKMYEKSEPIFIYDRDERFQLFLSDDTLPYIGDFVEQLNGELVLEFEVPVNDPDVALIEPDGRAVTRGPDGDLVEFIIRNVEDVDDLSGTFKKVTAEGGEYELIDEIITQYKADNVTLRTALGAILSGTRWQVGNVDNFGTDSVNLENVTVKYAIYELLQIFEGEINYRVEASGNQITRRYIDVLKRRGVNMGKRFESGKDIVKASRLVDTTGIKTAMYGRGKSGENNKPRLTFADVVWRKSDGDPADKPLGQTWVGDPDALQKWGYAQGTRHRFGFYDGQEEDPAELLFNTWRELQKVKDANETYEFDLLLLEELTGMPHEKVRLGDVVYAVNRRVQPPIEIEMSIIEYRHNLNDRKLSSVVVGNFRRKYDIDSRFDRIERIVNDRQGNWDEKVDVEDLDNEAQRLIDEAQARIDAAKIELEEAVGRIEQTKIDLDDAAALIQDTIDNPQNYAGNFDGDVAADRLILRDELVSVNARITGTIQAGNATFMNADIMYGNIIEANIQNAQITGQLDSVNGTFVGDLVGARILSNTSISVNTNAYIGNNIYLGNQFQSTSKAVFFNNNAVIRSSGLPTTEMTLETDRIFLDGNVFTRNPIRGWCGVGGYSWGVSSTACIQGVNFGISKWVTPSSITFLRHTGNRSAYYAETDPDGFTFYINGEGTNGLVHWRGNFYA